MNSNNNLLQECLSQGFDLPYFCWHPCMGSVGACRQCAVKQYKNAEDKDGELVMACMTPVTEDAIISIKDEQARAFRANVIESLMISHPHDCPVCEEGGECHLQDMTLMSGHTYRRYDKYKVTHRNQYLGPLINHEMNRCIACYRCVRFYDDYAGGTDLSAQASHHHVYFGRHRDGVLENEFSGNLVEVCPTGVFTDKVFSEHYTRKWDLQTAPSVCTGCAVGCNTAPGERYGSLRRIVNRYNSEVNGYFLCDRGRFGAGFVNNPERLTEPVQQVRGAQQSERAQVSGEAQASEEAQVSGEKMQATAITMEEVASLLSKFKSKDAIGIGSPRASNESNFALRSLVGADNFYSGSFDNEFETLKLMLELTKDKAFHQPSVREIEQADAILILGEDVTNTAPRLALALRQSVRNKALALADTHKIPHWQDEAVRELAQHERSPLTIVSSYGTRLDDVASSFIQLEPDEIPNFGFALAHTLNEKAPAAPATKDKKAQASVSVINAKGEAKTTIVGKDSADWQQQLSRIAKELSTAKNPLVIAGTGLANTESVRAAANVARALAHKRNGEPVALCLLCGEVNAMGATLLTEPDNALSAALERINSGQAKHLLVLENNLYQRAAHSTVEAALHKAETVVALDQLPTATTARADYVLPVTSFNEHSATYVNYEGRVQLSLQVQQAESGARASWHWLSPNQHFEDAVRACATGCPALAPLTELLPDATHLIAGMKVPRQPHRYSGRTAMIANLNVHEPKQAEDKESALSFSMEGIPPQRDASLIASSWAPNWNSNQSISKFQHEVNGELKQGHTGTLLFTQKDKENDYFAPVAAKTTATPSVNGSGLRVVPVWQIFGSDELSARTPAIQERMTAPYVALAPAQAAHLGLAHGDVVKMTGAGNAGTHDQSEANNTTATNTSAMVCLRKRVPENVAAIYAGADEIDIFSLGSHISLVKVDSASDTTVDTVADATSNATANTIADATSDTTADTIADATSDAESSQTMTNIWSGRNLNNLFVSDLAEEGKTQ